jgi:hypothetical protein
MSISYLIQVTAMFFISFPVVLIPICFGQSFEICLKKKSEDIKHGAYITINKVCHRI